MEFVKIKSGATYARMLNSEFSKYVVIYRGVNSPGDGWYPVEKVLPKPVPGDGEELGYTYTVDTERGIAYKEYFIQRQTPMYDKYELVMAIERAGFLDDFVSLIKSDPVLEMKWNAADYLDFSDGTLQEAIDAIKESLGVTDEQVEAILAQAEVST